MSVQEYSAACPGVPGSAHPRQVGTSNLGTLFVVATPIGNLEDLSPRALRTLHDVSLIAAEDTRHSGRLLDRFGVKTPLLSYHQHNQRERRDRLLHALSLGDVALITDAGTPAISDPGADLVAAALAAGHRVSPVPGPSALTAAISASGLIDGPFMSLGFLPRERAERKHALARAAASDVPIVLFESAKRIAATLQEFERVLGSRQAVVARELTKLHEEVKAGTLGSLAEWAAERPLKGEIAVIIAGASRGQASDDVGTLLRSLRAAGLSASQSAREAAAITGLPRSELYAMAMTLAAGASVRLESELALANEDALQNPLGDEKRPEGRES